METLNIFLKPEVIWFMIGLIFLLLEFAIPGLIIIFFGIGCWVTSISLLIFDPSLNSQIVIFLVASVLSLVLLRKTLKRKFYDSLEKGSDELEDEFIGKTAIIEKEIKAPLKGKINFKGTVWDAIADSNIKEGEVVKIISKDSIVLKVEKVN